MKPNLTETCEWGQKVWVHDGTNSKLDGRAKVAHWVSFDPESWAYHIYWPKKTKVSMECNIQFKCDHILVTEPPPLTDPPITTPTAAAPISPRTEQTPAPADPLQGLEDTHAPWPEGHRARAKQPSAYAHYILTGEGSASGMLMIEHSLVESLVRQ